MIIQVHPAAHEGLSSFLFDLGCEGIVNESFGDKCIKTCLPENVNPEDFRAKIERYIQNLKEIFPDIKECKLSFNRIKDQDWSLNWRKFFRPELVTENLLVIPAWESVTEEPGTHIIRIDPGPAFGTGQHPTTRMCLSAMERIGLNGEFTLLDVGTGSGILAMYGAILGASRVMAIDVDPEAVRWGRYNIELNSLTGKIQISTTEIGTIEETFSLVMGNLIFGTIMELAEDLFRVLAPEGSMILSGILKEQAEIVEQKFNGFALNREEVLYEDEWACILFKK